MQSETLAEFDARMRAKRAKRDADWKRAVEKLSVTFEADHGGGCPACLKDKKPAERLTFLRALGFRIKDQFELDQSAPGSSPDMHQCCHLMGGIYVDLTDGWVCREKRGKSL